MFSVSALKHRAIPTDKTNKEKAIDAFKTEVG